MFAYLSCETILELFLTFEYPLHIFTHCDFTMLQFFYSTFLIILPIINILIGLHFPFFPGNKKKKTFIIQRQYMFVPVK